MVKKLCFILLLLTVIAVCALAESPTIVITPEKDSYQLGEAMRFHFDITGGSQPYQSVTTCWNVSKAFFAENGEYVLAEGWIDQRDWETTSGDVVMENVDAQRIGLMVEVIDADGNYYRNDRTFTFYNEYKPKPVPYSFTCSYSASTVEVGSAVTAQYSITGNYQKLEYGWSVEHGNSSEWAPTGELAGASGSISHTPQRGDGTRLMLMPTDADGLRYALPCGRVTVTGDTSEPLVVTLAANTYQAATGDLMEVNYSVSGGTGEYRFITYQWVDTSNGAFEAQKQVYLDKNQPSGTISLIAPESWESCTLTMHAVDTSGTSEMSFLPEDIVITPKVPAVELTSDLETYAVGDTVTVHYKVNADCDTVNYCFTPYLGGQDNPKLYQEGELTAMEGDVSYTVAGGDSVQTFFNLYKNEKWVDNSELILPVTGYPYGPIVVTAAIDADTATVGVPLTFHYSVTGGSGSYESVDVYMDQQNKAYDRAGDGWYEYEMQAYQGCGASGTLTYLPTQAGDKINPTIIVHDQEGWYAFYNGNDDIQVQPGAIHTLDLPDDLKTIEASAFEGVDAQMVILPDGCESIGPRAFADSSVRVVVIPGSVTAIDDTAFDGLPGSLYLLDITENNDEVWRMAQKLGCSYMTHVSFGW